MNLSDLPFISVSICAGARNISIIQTIIDAPLNIPITHHFDEREASFFALGTARRHNKPVAVLCTSGTAVSECYSALIESYYSGIPLVIVSADRPRSYRQTGAPQAIEQDGIFLPYCQTQDIEIQGKFDLNYFNNVLINQVGPTHINFCLDDLCPSAIKTSNLEKNSLSDEEKLKSFFTNCKHPVVLLSGLQREWQTPVCNTLRNLNLAIYAESTSGLRESTLLTNKSLKSGEKILSFGSNQKLIDGVLKIGSTPTARFYRELDSFSGPILSIDSKIFSGSISANHIQCDDIRKPLNWISIHAAKHHLNKQLFDNDRFQNQRLIKLLYEFPNSEPELIHRLSLVIHPHDQVFLGNSLPIREWELSASRSVSHELVFAQRGTNGIDGQLSNFLGGLDSLRHNFGIFGDLTTIYGNNGLWALKFLKQFPLTIVAVNNFGGQIFSRVPSIKNCPNITTNSIDIITNSHEYDLSKLAQFWQIGYSKINSIDEQITPKIRAPGHRLVELIPDPEQTNNFWQKYDSE